LIVLSCWSFVLYQLSGSNGLKFASRATLSKNCRHTRESRQLTPRLVPNCPILARYHYEWVYEHLVVANEKSLILGTPSSRLLEDHRYVSLSSQLPGRDQRKGLI